MRKHLRSLNSEKSQYGNVNGANPHVAAVQTRWRKNHHDAGRDGDDRDRTLPETAAPHFVITSV
jgi:hypothetical protein